MAAECPNCGRRVQIPYPAVELTGEPLAAAPAGEPMGPSVVEPAAPAASGEAVGDEARLFAEQMGLPVEAPDDGEPAAEAPVVSTGDQDDWPLPAVGADAAADPAAGELGLDGAPDTSAAARAARANRHHAVSRRKAQHEFKKVAIPMMVVVGVLLVIAGAWSWGMHIPQTASGAQMVGVNAVRYFSFPLAIFLLFGAGWFLWDTRRRSKRNGA